MWPLIKKFFAPILSSLLMMLGNGYFLSFITIRLTLGGFSEIWIGFVHGAFYFGLLLGAMKIENLVRRIGHIRALTAFSAISCSTILLQPFWIHPAYWMVLRFIAGIAMAGLFIVIESWLIAKSTEKNRGALLSIYMIALYGAQGFGQFFLDWLDLTSFTPYIVSGLFFALSIIPVALTYSSSPEIQEPNPFGWKKLFHSSTFGFIGCLSSGLILGAIYAFMPAYALFTNESVSWIVSTTIIGGLCLQWPIGHLSDLFDRRLVLILISALMLIPTLILILFDLAFIPTLITVFILGGFAFTLYPVAIAQVCDHFETKDLTRITCMLIFVYGLGAALGPPISSIGIQLFDARALFGYIFINLILLIGVGLYSILYRPAIADEAKVPYHPLPRISPIFNFSEYRKKRKEKRQKKQKSDTSL